MSWGAATDNVGVVRYNVHRGTSAGFTPTVGNRIAQPTSPGYVDATAAGSYFYKVTAEDAAGNIGPASNEAAATTVGTRTRRRRRRGSRPRVTGSTVNLDLDCVDRRRWRRPLQRSSQHHTRLHAGGGQPHRTAHQPAWGDSGLSIGTYYYQVTAEDAAGNISSSSSEIGATSPTRPRRPRRPASPRASPAAPSTSAGRQPPTTSASSATTSTAARRRASRRARRTGSHSRPGRLSGPGLAPGTYFYKVTAEDAAGNIGPVSNTASATVADATAPSAPGASRAVGGAGQAALSWAASTDNVGVLATTSTARPRAASPRAAGNRIAQPTGPSYTDTGLAAGTYFYRVTAEDAAGNISAASAQATASVAAPPAIGLVAAYGFDAGSGTATADQSGNGNNGSLSDATWAGATAGKFGNALCFNGSSSFVTIPDSSTLDLTTGMTLEAWVRPTTLASWNTVIFKERPGDYAYALYANTGTTARPRNMYNGGDHDIRGTAQVATGAWTHLAATYDGSVLALYVNGTQAATLLTSGSIVTSTAR